MGQFKPKTKKEQDQLRLDIGLGKVIEANFDGGRISSDGGSLLLRKADEWLELTETSVFCFAETRRADLIKHTVERMLRQRMYGIAQLYEDCNDAAMLRFDDMHKLAAGRLPSEAALASQPTLSRFENNVDEQSLKALQLVLLHAYVRMFNRGLRKKHPKVVRLQMDTTCDEIHGYQQMTFYNGFYQTQCYVPLFIFTDDGFPLIALLRPGNAAPGDGALRMLKLVVENLRMAWAGVRIEVVADSAFALPEIYDYCEKNAVTYFIAMKNNSALDYHTNELLAECKKDFDSMIAEPSAELKHGKMPENERYKAWRQNEERKRFSRKSEGRMQEYFEQDEQVVRRFKEFQYDAKEWPHKRRIIAKVDFKRQGPDRRYVVTNTAGSKARALYDKYCLRARCENFIKDMKNYLRCDRTSCQEFNANQFRLLEHTFAYALIWKIKQAAGLQTSTVESLRLQLLKVGVLVHESNCKVRLSLASQHPYQLEFIRAWQALERTG